MLSSLFLSFSFPPSILRPISSIRPASYLPLVSLFRIISHNRETIRSGVLYVRDRGRLSGRWKVHVNVKIGYDRIYRFLLSRRSDSICRAIGWNYSFQSREHVALPVRTIDEFVVGLGDRNPRDRTKFINCGMRMKSGLRIVSAGWRRTIGISIWRGSIDSSMNEGTQLQRRRYQSSTNELTSISKRKKISVRMVSSRYWRIRSRRLRTEWPYRVIYRVQNVSNISTPVFASILSVRCSLCDFLIG